MRSVNCTINLEQGAFINAILTPDNGSTLYAGAVTEPGRLRFFLPDDAVTGGGSITAWVPGKATWTGRTLMDGEGPVVELVDGQPVPFGKGAWPTPPIREAVLTARVGFQGLTIQTQQFGAIRAWGPEIGSLNDADADSYVQQALAAGFDAVEFAVSWNYQEPTSSYPVPGSDLSTNLPELKRRIVRAIRAGGSALHAVFLFCAGDGESVNDDPQPRQYNDPAGWTYGRQWLMRHFQSIYEAMGPTADSPEDCRPFLVFVPGYDACDAYAWVSGQNVADWWHLERATIDAGGAGYAGFEWPSGRCSLGDGFPTYAPENGGCVDVWLLEEPPGPYPPSDTTAIQQITQQLGRMCRPYIRPSWAVDDPHPPYYGPFLTPRGPATVQVYEFDTYPWVRGMTPAQVESDRNVLRSIVPETVIC